MIPTAKPGTNPKTHPIQPTNPCMLHPGPWLVEEGCPSQNLCWLSA
jgi:hypothetical protein